jgi:ABC-type amino acid transport substrate-binding protein
MIRNLLFSAVFFSFFSCSGTKNGPILRVAFDSGYFAKNMQTTRMKAFLDELVQNLQKKMGVFIDLVPSSEDSLQDLLEKKRIDLIFSDLPRSIIFEKEFVFSEPVLYNGYYLVTNKQDERRLENLESRRVLLLNNEEATVLIASYPKIDFGFYNDDRDAFLQLSRSSCSAILVPVVDFRVFQNEYSVQPQEITQRNFRFITLKVNDKAQRVFNEVKTMIKEGKIDQLKEKWQINP